MLAAIKVPREPWRCLEVEPTLEYINSVVCGNIEMVPNFHTSAVMYCNEEGKILNLLPNFYIKDQNGKVFDVIVGTVIMFGPSKHGSETDLSIKLFKETVASLQDV
jgi:hypothetical protein